jgi:hypothetical protein
MWQQDTNTAQQVAKGFADSGSRFAAAFIAQLEATNADGVSLQEHWRTEACAAVWAAISATFHASHYSKEEQAVLLPIVMQHLGPFWGKHCGHEPDMIRQLTDRAEHYLRSGEPGDVAQSAANIVSALLAAVGTANTSRPITGRVLASSLSHRMLADLRRLDAMNGPKTSVGLTSGPNKIRLGQVGPTRALLRAHSRRQ